MSQRLLIYEVVVPLKEHISVQPEWLSFSCVLLRGDMEKDIWPYG